MVAGIEGPKTSRRRPLQPKNQTSSEATTTITNTRQKPPEWDNSNNKENLYNYLPPSFKKDSSSSSFSILMDYSSSSSSSLADELSAVREKLERLRIDRDNNDKLLGERGAVLDMRFKEIVNRGEVQKLLEMEVDRLYRLNEIRLLACSRISQIRSLRDKEEEKKMKRDIMLTNKAHTTKGEDRDDERKDERSSRGITEAA